MTTRTRSERGMDERYSHEDLFRWWVMQQQQMVMLQLGKLAHPATGKIERDLDAARLFIDLLAMMEAKTKGNLNEEEERLLGAVLTNLRLNFVQESSRAEPGESTSTDAGGGSPAEGSAPPSTQEEAGMPDAGQPTEGSEER